MLGYRKRNVEHAQDCTGCASDDTTIPRRRFLRGALVMSAAVAGALGGTVGFAPSAIAQVNCSARPPSITACGPNFIACIGPCAAFRSCCTYGPAVGYSKCCQCSTVCQNARVVVYASGKACYYCCRYC